MSDVEKNPRAEVIEETSETLDVLRLDHTARAEKMAREKALFAGAAEVQLSERSVTLHEGIDAVREHVDALETVKRDLPEARPPPPAPVLAPEPVAEPPQAELTDKERAAVEKLVPGRLIRIDTIYQTTAGQAVEATYEQEGKTRRRAYLVRDGAAADIDELGRVLDEIPTPTVEEEIDDEPEGAAPEPAPEPAPKPEVAPEPSATEPEADSETPEPEAPERKRRFSFGKKKEAAAPPPKEAASEQAPSTDEPAPRRRFGRMRK